MLCAAVDVTNDGWLDLIAVQATSASATVFTSTGDPKLIGFRLAWLHGSL
jgi:hypothetical protein